MRAVVAAMALAGFVSAGESEVVVEVREGPSVEGVLLGSAPLNVETRYGALSIPSSDLLSIDPREGLALAHAGAVRGRFDWTDLAVRTRYGEARLPLKDAVRVTWRRERTPPNAKHYLDLADGTSLGGAIVLEDFDFATAYGALRIPLSEVRLLVREGADFRLRLADMTLRGEPRVEGWTVDTPYGGLRVSGGDLVRLATRPIPREGDRIEGGYVVRATDAHGASAYALVVRDPPMTWQEAADLARRMGGHLATVADDGENGFLCRLAVSKGPTAQPWIGFSDEGHEGSWRWVTGESVRYTNWNRGEPNNSGGRENCCELLGNGCWNDVDGGTGRFACLVEIDP
jgi:hypothetical protein